MNDCQVTDILIPLLAKLAKKPNISVELNSITGINKWNAKYNIFQASQQIELQANKESMKMLTAALKLTQFRKLSINITDEFSKPSATQIIADYSKALATQQQLILYSSQLKGLSILQSHAILAGLASVASLAYLNISCGEGIGEGGAAMVSSIVNNNNITELHLPGCIIDCSQIKIICEHIAKNTSLKVLDFNDNKIRNKGAEDMAFAIKNNQHLQKIYIRKNNVEDEGLVKLFNILDTIPTLLLIDITHNDNRKWQNEFEELLGESMARVLYFQYTDIVYSIKL